MKKPSFTEENLNWDAFNGNSKQFTRVKNTGIKENNRPEQKPISSTIYKQQTSPQEIDTEVKILLKLLFYSIQ